MIYHKKAFTLLELMVVIAIIGILLGILFTGWNYINDQQYRKKTELEIVGLRNAIDEYLTDLANTPIAQRKFVHREKRYSCRLPDFIMKTVVLNCPLIHPRFHPIFSL